MKPLRVALPEGMLRFLNPALDSDIPLGNTGLVLEKHRRFVRKTITLGLAIVTLAPLIWWKNQLAAGIYLGVLVLIHVFALAVFAYRIEWRDLFQHRWGLVSRVSGLVIFGGLLTLLKFDPDSGFFWFALTLLWAFHVGALATLHIRHRSEMRALASGEDAKCPIPWPESVRDGEKR